MSPLTQRARVTASILLGACCLLLAACGATPPERYSSAGAAARAYGVDIVGDYNRTASPSGQLRFARVARIPLVDPASTPEALEERDYRVMAVPAGARSTKETEIAVIGVLRRHGTQAWRFYWDVSEFE